MKQVLRIVLMFFIFISSLIAEQLDIKVEQNSLSLPYWPAQMLHYGAVLIVRGGEQPEWSQLLARLAKQLSKNGWSVVLLNCKPNQSVPWIKQIPEAINTLRQDNNKRIVLIHYGEQLNLTFDYFSKPQSKMINGLVLISAYDNSTDSENTPSLRFPLVDIAGQFDYDTVLTQMQYRDHEFKQHDYLSMKMPGAQHDYEYSQKYLVSFIHGWMAKLPATERQPPPILVSYIEPVYSSQARIVAEAGL